jgi:uncharacterized protein (UPF0305 family)
MSKHMIINVESKDSVLKKNSHVKESLDRFLNLNPTFACTESELDSYIRYIALVYDPYSPYVRKYPDIRKRKDNAARKIGIRASSVPISLIVWFLRDVIQNTEWVLIASNENTFDEFVERVNTPISDFDDDEEKLIKAVERKSKLLDYMQQINKRIKDLKKTFYQEDDDLLENEKKFNYNPENIAQAAKEFGKF